MRPSTLLIPVLFLLAGCTMPLFSDGPFDATVLKASFTLTNTQNETLSSAVGAHCDRVSIDNRMATLGLRGDTEGPEEGPFLVISPLLSGHWQHIGSSPVWEQLPYSISPGVAEYPKTLGTIHHSNGTTTVDGTPVELPYTWHVEGPEGRWHTNVTLSHAADQVQYEQLRQCI